MVLRRLPFAAALVVAVACCSSPGSGGDGAPPDGAVGPRVLLIGIDGVRPDVLRDVPTPHMDALAEEGWIFEAARTTNPSVSGPSWSSMLIGVWPEKHGVVSNDFVAPRYDEYPDFLTRLERSDPSLTTVAIADWLPVVESETSMPIVSDEVDVKHVLDGYELGWAEADSVGAGLAAEALRDGDPDALFLYLGNPDETSHQNGSIGAEYREAIALADRHVGQVIDALRTRPDAESAEWLVLVTTDHGRREDGGHGGDSPEEMTTFLIASGAGAGPPPTEVAIPDVAVTALGHMGLAPAPEWGLDGRDLSRRGVANR